MNVDRKRFWMMFGCDFMIVLTVLGFYGCFGVHARVISGIMCNDRLGHIH